jgi:hypothetical protein
MDDNTDAFRTMWELWAQFAVWYGSYFTSPPDTLWVDW